MGEPRAKAEKEEEEARGWLSVVAGQTPKGVNSSDKVEKAYAEWQDTLKELKKWEVDEGYGKLP